MNVNWKVLQHFLLFLFFMIKSQSKDVSSVSGATLKVGVKVKLRLFRIESTFFANRDSNFPCRRRRRRRRSHFFGIDLLSSNE